MSEIPRTLSGWLVILLFSVSIVLILMWLAEKFFFKSSPTNVLWIWSIITFILSFIIGMISPEVQRRHSSELI